MINANELRIGNFIKSSQKGWVLKVDYLLTNKIGASYNNNLVQKIPTEFEPIQLTPEILEKVCIHSHFTSDPQEPNASKRYVFASYNIEQPNENKNEFLFEHGFVINVSSVHQLQNLHFALELAELQIEL